MEKGSTDEKQIPNFDNLQQRDTNFLVSLNPLQQAYEIQEPELQNEYSMHIWVCTYIYICILPHDLKLKIFEKFPY